jgi:hypothetical protein
MKSSVYPKTKKKKHQHMDGRKQQRGKTLPP